MLNKPIEANLTAEDIEVSAFEVLATIENAVAGLGTFVSYSPANKYTKLTELEIRVDDEIAGILEPYAEDSYGGRREVVLVRHWLDKSIKIRLLMPKEPGSAAVDQPPVNLVGVVSDDGPPF